MGKMSNNSTYLFLFKLSCAISLLGLCVITFEIGYTSYHGDRGRVLKRIQKAFVVEAMNETIPMQMTSPRQKRAHSSTNRPYTVVIFNVLPKSGSRTLDRLVKKLNKNITMLSTMNSVNETQEEKSAIIRRAIRSNRTTFVYSHNRYEWLGPYGPAFGVRRPVYISLVRDPIERLASAYYFLRYGDSLPNKTQASYQFRELMDSRNYRNETFDECILRRDRICWNPGALVRHFSGYEPHWTLKRSLINIDKKYLVVGIMEDYTSFLKILEQKVPDVFGGIVALYEEEKISLVTSMKTKNKRTVSPKVRKILRKDLVEDYKVYDVVKSKFETLKQDLNIS